MARRKRDLDDGDDSDASDSSNADFGDFGLNADERDEQDLLSNPYGRKRRRRANGKEDATYGVFGEDSEDEGFKSRKNEKRSDWAKAPAFISSEKKVDITEDNLKVQSSEEDSDEADGEAIEEDDVNAASSEDASQPPSPRIREEEEDYDEPSLSRGLGSGTPTFSTADNNSGAPSIGAAKAGIGSKGGIGSSTMDSNLPSAFGSSRPQRAFVRQESSQSPRPSTPLSLSEQVHFSKLSGSFGSRMLSKMGWQAGTGLGTEGAGIVTPVESKLRPKGMGIAFKGFKEKTEQSKAEARRRGEVVSDDEEKPGGARGRKAKAKQHTGETKEEVWKRPKRTKVKTEHKTYEEIIAATGIETPASGLGKIIDATGAELREVSSLADVATASWTPSTDPMRIPEARHNLRLITEDCRVQLEGLAREARTISDRKTYIEREDLRLRKKVEQEAELIKRLQALHLAVDEISAKAKEAAMSDYEPSLAVFSTSVEKLATGYPSEFDRYRVDEVVVAAIAPTFRRAMSSWKPLEQPEAHVNMLRRWRKALKMAHEEPVNDMQIDSFGAKAAPKPLSIDEPMSPYESLLWNVWLPRVRSAINNDWSPTVPYPAVRLYESWSDVLPAFIKDNILDQLILPKSIVFPWLPHVGLRLETFVDDSRRKIKSMLRSWSARDGIPKDLLPWKDVFGSRDWEDMLLKYVVPKISSLLREEFKVNPRNQNMDPLKQAFAWSDILRPSVLGQILEKELFPKWLDVLHIWLVQPSANFEEVAHWYQFWKSSFPENVRALPAVENGFVRGLQMINHALELGKDAPTKLPKPVHSDQLPKTAGTAKAKPSTSRAKEVTFREIVEEFVASHNLLFMPAGKVDEKSRMPLYRISRSVEGRGGVFVYLLDDATWIPEEDGARAVTLEELVLRATKS